MLKNNEKITKREIYEAVKGFKEKVQNQDYKNFTDVDFLLLETCQIFDNWNNNIILGNFEIENDKYYCTIYTENDDEEDIEILDLQGFLEDYQINLPCTKGAIEFVEIALEQRKDFSPEISERIGYYGTI